jgi:hypothetical protein
MGKPMAASGHKKNFFYPEDGGSRLPQNNGMILKIKLHQILEDNNVNTQRSPNANPILSHLLHTITKNNNVISYQHCNCTDLFLRSQVHALQCISIVNPTRFSNFSNLFYFWDNTLHVLDGLSVCHQKLKTVQTATGICHQQVLLPAC